VRPYLIAAAFACLFTQGVFGQTTGGQTTFAQAASAQMPAGQTAGSGTAANPSPKAVDPAHSGAATPVHPAGGGSATGAKRISPAAQAAQPKVIPVDATDWRFAYPDSMMRMSINVGRMLRSPMVIDAIKNAPGAAQLQISLGLKMIQGIEKVQIAVRQGPGGTTSAKAGPKSTTSAPGSENNPDMLVLITGQLDPTLQQTIMQQSATNAMAARQIAPDVLLLGKTPQVESAIKRMTGAPVGGDDDSLSDSDLWISGDAAQMTAPVNRGNAAQPDDPSWAQSAVMAMHGVDTLKRFSLGLNVRDPFELSVNLQAANEAGADQLLGLYNTAMAANSGKTPDEFAPLVDRVRVGRQGSEIQFRFSAPVAMLQTAFAKSQALRDLGSNPALPAGLSGMLGGGSAGIGPARSATRAPQAAPAPQGKIMIYGLDDGPREVGAPGKK
jgi:hypothetical protein